MAFKEITSGERVKFDHVGESVEGRLVSINKVANRDGEYMRYTVRAGDENKTFNGCYALDEVIPGIAIGSLIRVEYLGKDNIGGGKSFKRFKVMVDEGAQTVA